MSGSQDVLRLLRQSDSPSGGKTSFYFDKPNHTTEIITFLRRALFGALAPEGLSAETSWTFVTVT